MDQSNPADLQQRHHIRDIQQRLMQGSESELRGWMKLSAAKRTTESTAFIAIYLAGALVTSLSSQSGPVLSSALFWLGVLLMGIAYNSLGLFLHEGLHGSLSRNKKTNKRWSFIVGLPLLISASAYRVTHTYHHIELGQARDYGTYKQHTKYAPVIWLCYYLQLFIGSLIYIACIPFLGYKQANGPVKRRILIEYFIIGSVLLLVTVFTSHSVIAFYWFLPILVMNVMTNIRGLASHALGDTGDPLLASRTISASPLLSWLMLYENYHLAHHLFPKIPSYHLKAVHDHIWHQIPRACWNESYGSFLGNFVQASVRGDLKPLGYIQPDQTLATENN